CELSSGHKSVAPDIIQSVGVELAGDNRSINCGRPAADVGRNHVSESVRMTVQDFADGAGLRRPHQFFGVILMLFEKSPAEVFSEALKCMAKWAVADVMHKRGRKRGFGFDLLVWLIRYIALYNPHQLTRCVEHSNRMRKT